MCSSAEGHSGLAVVGKVYYDVMNIIELQVKQEEISSLGRACQETSKAPRLSDTLSLQGSLPAVFSFFVALSLVLLEC